MILFFFCDLITEPWPSQSSLGQSCWSWPPCHFQRHPNAQIWSTRCFAKLRLQKQKLNVKEEKLRLKRWHVDCFVSNAQWDRNEWHFERSWQDVGHGKHGEGTEGDMCPTARLRIAFSGQQEAKNSGIAKTTVAETRKSAAKAYIQAQCFLAKDCPKDARQIYDVLKLLVIQISTVVLSVLGKVIYCWTYGCSRESWVLIIICQNHNIVWGNSFTVLSFSTYFWILLGCLNHAASRKKASLGMLCWISKT